MFHSLTIGDRNTFDSWHLIPQGRQIVTMPPLKETRLDIPGSNGDVDLSTALTGYPLYQNRTGSWTFIILNELNGVENYDYATLYSDMAFYLHGQERKIIFDDDPDYYYVGRLTLGDWTPEEYNSTITINYTLDPYKYELEDMVTKNPDFFTFKSVSASSDSPAEIFDGFMEYFSGSPIHPIITARPNSGSMRLFFTNEELNMDRSMTIVDGVQSAPRFTITNFSGSNKCLFRASGDGEILINFRNGRL